MRENARRLRHLLILGLGLAMAIPEAAEAAPRRNERSDHCIILVVDGIVTNQTLVFRDVPTLAPGLAVPLNGLYFTTSRVPVPVDGSAVVAGNGMVRVGMMVHTSARRPEIGSTDFVLTGETDASLAGVVHFKLAGEFTSDRLVELLPVDCATIDVP